MFGILRPALPNLPSAERSQYMAEYCNACASLSYAYGIMARPFVVHDIATLAWLSRAAEADELPFRTHNCLKGGALLKGKLGQLPKRQTLIAALSAATVAVKTADDVADSSAILPRITNFVGGPIFNRAAQDLHELGFEFDRLRQALATQSEVEVSRETRLEVASSPTGECYSLAAQSITEATSRLIHPNFAGSIGRLLGQIVFVVDALRDYHSDLGRAYNPLHWSQSVQENQQAAAQRREDALDFIFEKFRELRTLAESTSEQVTNRLASLQLSIARLLGLTKTEVTLFAACCIPCGDGAILVDGNDLFKIWTGLCCCCCIASCFCRF
jgi:hypothetical protein